MWVCAVGLGLDKHRQESLANAEPQVTMQTKIGYHSMGSTVTAIVCDSGGTIIYLCQSIKAIRVYY